MAWKLCIISNHIAQFLSLPLRTFPEVMSYFRTTILYTSSRNDSLALFDKQWTSCWFLSFLLSSNHCRQLFHRIFPHKLYHSDHMILEFNKRHLPSRKVPIRSIGTCSSSQCVWVDPLRFVPSPSRSNRPSY